MGRLLALLLALTIVPWVPPAGTLRSSGAATSQRESADRHTNRTPVASLTESFVTHLSPLQISGRDVRPAPLRGVLAWPTTAGSATTRPRHDRRTLPQGSALVPLRI